MKRAVLAAFLLAAAAVPAHAFAQAEPVPPPPAVGPNGEPLAPPPPAVNQYGQPIAPPPPAVNQYGQPVVAPPPAVYGAQPVYAAPPPAVTQAQPYPTRRHHLDLHHGRMVFPDDGGPIPPGAVRESHMSRGKFIGGLVITGLLWEVSVDVAGYCGYLNWAARGADAVHLATLPRCPDAINWLYLPVAGPYIAAFSPGMPEWASVLLVIDGAIQSVGFLLSIIGMADQQHYYVINTRADGDEEEEHGPRRRREVQRSYAVAPVAGPTSAGLAFAMTF